MNKLTSRFAKIIGSLALAGAVVLPAAALEHGNAPLKNPNVVAGNSWTKSITTLGSRWA